MISGGNVINLSSLESYKEYDIGRQRLVSQLKYDMGRQRHQFEQSCKLKRIRYRVATSCKPFRIWYRAATSSIWAVLQAKKICYRAATSSGDNHVSSLASHNEYDIGRQRLVSQSENDIGRQRHQFEQSCRPNKYDIGWQHHRTTANLSSLASQKEYDVGQKRLVSQLESYIGRQRHRATTNLSNVASQTDCDIGW